MAKVKAGSHTLANLSKQMRKKMLHTNFACMLFNTNEMIRIKMARVILAFLAKEQDLAQVIQSFRLTRQSLFGLFATLDKTHYRIEEI